MFILDRIDREVHSLKRLELKLGLSSEFSEFFHKIPVRILLDVLFRVFRFFKSLFYALTSSFMKLYRGIQRPFSPQCIDNTFWAIQSTFGCLEMHSKRRYKICICSVILGERNSKLQGLEYYFPKILDAIWRITKVRNFLLSLSIAFLSPKF